MFFLIENRFLGLNELIIRIIHLSHGVFQSLVVNRNLNWNKKYVLLFKNLRQFIVQFV